MNNKILIFFIIFSSLFVSCKKKEEDIYNREYIQIGPELESFKYHEKIFKDKEENQKKEVGDKNIDELSYRPQPIVKSKKENKKRKRLLSGITPLSE